MSRRLTAAPRSGLVLFLTDTGVTARRKATAQNLPAPRASPRSLFAPSSAQRGPRLFQGCRGFPLHGSGRRGRFWGVSGNRCGVCFRSQPRAGWHPEGQALCQSSPPSSSLLSPFLDGISSVGGDKATMVCPFLG